MLVCLDTAVPCQYCPSSCSSCSSPDVCVSCWYGHELSGNTCILICPDGCENCSSQSSCTTCITGYHLSYYSCYIDCPSGCICLSPNVCTSCITGYTESNGSCYMDCPQTMHCRKCSSPNVCASCETGYYITGETCKEDTMEPAAYLVIFISISLGVVVAVAVCFAVKHCCKREIHPNGDCSLTNPGQINTAFELNSISRPSDNVSTTQIQHQTQGTQEYNNPVNIPADGIIFPPNQGRAFPDSPPRLYISQPGNDGTSTPPERSSANTVSAGNQIFPISDRVKDSPDSLPPLYGSLFPPPPYSPPPDY